MKKIIFGFVFLLTISTVTACTDSSPEQPPVTNENNNGDNVSDNDNKDKEDKPEEDIKNEEDNKEDKVLTQEEVLEAVKEQIITDLDVVLPKSLPLSEDEHLTALTRGEKNSYSVVFYKSNEPISINNKELVNGSDAAKEIARLQVEKTSSKEEAKEKISFEDFSVQGGREVDLGHGITGYIDVGAGSAFTGWNEGRWSLTSRSLISEEEKGVKLAKETVEFLESNTLPIPNKYGNIHLDTELNGNLALWQNEDIVYTLDKVKHPMDMLKMLVEFK